MKKALRQSPIRNANERASCKLGRYLGVEILEVGFVEKRGRRMLGALVVDWMF